MSGVQRLLTKTRAWTDSMCILQQVLISLHEAFVSFVHVEDDEITSASFHCTQQA